MNHTPRYYLLREHKKAQCRSEFRREMQRRKTIREKVLVIKTNPCFWQSGLREVKK